MHVGKEKKSRMSFYLFIQRTEDKMSKYVVCRNTRDKRLDIQMIMIDGTIIKKKLFLPFFFLISSLYDKIIEFLSITLDDYKKIALI